MSLRRRITYIVSILSFLGTLIGILTAVMDRVNTPNQVIAQSPEPTTSSLVTETPASSPTPTPDSTSNTQTESEETPGTASFIESKLTEAGLCEFPIERDVFSSNASNANLVAAWDANEVRQCSLSDPVITRQISIYTSPKLVQVHSSAKALTSKNEVAIVGDAWVISVNYLADGTSPNSDHVIASILSTLGGRVVYK